MLLLLHRLRDAFGLAVLLTGLSLLAAVPGLHLLGVGYLLEVSGRIARDGKREAGRIGLRQAADSGLTAIAAAMVAAPLFLLASLRDSALLLDPSPGVYWLWTSLVAVALVAVVLHLLGGWMQGGDWRRMLWPGTHPLAMARRLGNQSERDALVDRFWLQAAQLRLPFFLWLGMRGSIGAILWVAAPAYLLSIGPQVRPVNLLGAAMMLAIGSLLPFLQVHLAVENRWRAIFDVRAVHRRFQRAPWAFFWSLFYLLAVSLLLYLPKVFGTPTGGRWAEFLVFFAALWTTRGALGRAYFRGSVALNKRSWIHRWAAGFLCAAAVGVYTTALFLSRYAVWEGWWSLFQQHAFLIFSPWAAQ